MSDVILFLIVFIIILSFLIFISFLVIDESSNNVIYQQCIPGDCAMDTRDGTKLCPGNTTDRVTADLSYQVCISRNYCNSSLTPFAILKDGSTNSQGICDSDMCRCSNTESCSYDRLVAFRDDGDFFTQIFLESQGLYKSQTVDSSNAFCGIHSSSLSKVGCIITDQSNIDVTEVANCVNNNFCKAGVAAFYPLDISTFEVNDALYNIPISCVPYFSEDIPSEGPLPVVCQSSQIPVWNKLEQRLICYDI